MIFGTRQKLKSNPGSCVIICNHGTSLHKVDKIKYLGVWLDSELSFKSHINHVLRKVNFGINVLHRSRNCFTCSVRKKIASQLILPILDYCDVVYQNAFKSYLVPLNTAHNRLCRFVLGYPFFTHHCTMYERLKWPSLNVRRHTHWLQLIFKCICFNYPPYLQQHIVPFTSNYQVRHSAQLYFYVLRAKKQLAKETLSLKPLQIGIIYPLKLDPFHYLVCLSMPCLLTLR